MPDGVQPLDPLEEPVAQQPDEERRTVRTFAAASLLNDMGSDMIFPVWPLFITEILGANMAVLGLIDGLGEAMVSISQAISGYASDRLRRRKIFIWIGYLMGALSRVGYAIAPTWQALIPFRLLDRAGKMRGAPRDAMVADVSGRATRGRNFGLLRAADHLGATIGVLLCMALLHFAVGYRAIFFLAAIPTLIGVVVIALAIHDRPAAEQHAFKGLRLSGFSRDLRLVILLSAVFALGSFTYSFLVVHAKRLGIADLYVPALYLLFTVAASVLSVPFGRLTDRWGRRWVLGIGYALWGLVCIAAVWLNAAWSAILIFLLFGAHKAALEPSQRAIVADLAPAHLRGSILGGFSMIVGLCALPASLLAGVLWDRLTPGTPFLASLGLTVIAIVLLTLVHETQEDAC